VRSALGQQILEAPCRLVDREDVVGRAVQDQCRNRDGGQVAAKVGRPGERCGRDGGVPGLFGTSHTGIHRLLRDALAEEVAEVVEIAEEPGEERIPVGGDGL
jgi:hypothetical protein